MDAREEQPVEQLACLAGKLELGLGIVIARSGSGDQAVARAPLAKVERRPKRVAGVGVAALLGGVDEIERWMAADERHLLNRLHASHSTSNYVFVGTDQVCWYR